MGATLAREVKIVFDHPFESGAMPAKEGQGRAVDGLTRRFAEGILFAARDEDPHID